MARVAHGRRRAVSVGGGATRHKQALKEDREKPSYKVVLEEISEKKKLKTFLSFNAEAPPGFTFIPAGDPQLTNRCKQLARDDGSTVYIVSMSDPKNPELSHEVHRVGYHFSSRVVENACLSLGVTLTESGRVLQSSFAALNEDIPTRHGKKVKAKGKGKGRASPPKFDLSMSQATIDTQAREAIRDLFPKIPEADLHETVARSFQKGRDLVGTSSDLSLARRAHLAVLAHIRHTHTNYDQILKLVPWADARKRVEGPTLDVLISWRDDMDDDTDVMHDVLREVIILSDNEDSEDNPVKGQNQSPRDQRPRDSSVEVVSASNNLHTRQLDLAVEPPESENERPIQYVPRQNPLDSQRSHNRLREERQGAHRHRRWEEAVNRQQRNPLPSTSLTHSAQPIIEEIYKTPLQSDSAHRRHASQELDQLPSHLIYGEKRVMRSDTSQSHLPLQRTDRLPNYMTEPNRGGTSDLANPMQKVDYSSQPRGSVITNPQNHSQTIYHTAEEPMGHSYIEIRDPLPLAPLDSTRFVKSQMPRATANVQYVDTDAPPHRRHRSERVLPSVEVDDSDDRDPARGSREGNKQRREIIPMGDLTQGRSQYMQSRNLDENSRLKRDRDEDYVDVVRDWQRLPPTFDERDRNVVVSTDERAPNVTVHRRHVEPTSDKDSLVVENDPRIVQLPPPRGRERVSDTHRQVQQVFRPIREEREQPHDAGYRLRGTLPYEDRHIHCPQPEQYPLPPVLYRTFEASPSSLTAPAFDASDPRIVRLETARDGRLFMPSEGSGSNVQHYGEQERGLRPAKKEVAREQRRPGIGAQLIPEEQRPRHHAVHADVTSTSVVRPSARPERVAYVENRKDPDDPGYGGYAEVRRIGQSNQYPRDAGNSVNDPVRVFQRRPQYLGATQAEEGQSITVIRRASQDGERDPPVYTQSQNIYELHPRPAVYRERARMYVEHTRSPIQSHDDAQYTRQKVPGEVVVLE